MAVYTLGAIEIAHNMMSAALRANHWRVPVCAAHQFTWRVRILTPYFTFSSIFIE